MVVEEPEYVAGIAARMPRKRVSAGVLYRDGDGRLLLVEPVYKAWWEIPGGVVEAGEEPLAACRREVLEELGLALPVGDLLVVDWVPPSGVWSDALNLVFDGGRGRGGVPAGLPRRRRASVGSRAHPAASRHGRFGWEYDHVGFVKARRRAVASGRRVAAWVVAAVFLGACSSPGPSTEGLSPASTSRAPQPLTGQIAFAHASTSDPGHEQIYLGRADGSDVRQLVRSPAGDTAPALSPDGRRLVFTRHLDPEPDAIFLVGVDGSGLRRLTPSGCPAVCGDAVEGPGWSPDGHTLVFTRAIFPSGSTKPANIELWLMDVGTGKARRLTHASLGRVGDRAGSQDDDAGWSPDGTRIVFTHWEHGIAGNPDQLAIETIKPDGTSRRQVTPNDLQAGEPAWSPDGTLIAYQSPPNDVGVTKDLYTIRPDGTGLFPVVTNLDVNDSDHPTWSPDSRRIAFSHVRPGATTGADLYVVNRDGSQPHPVAATPLNETDPSWAVTP